jgi:hypothetical protein
MLRQIVGGMEVDVARNQFFVCSFYIDKLVVGMDDRWRLGRRDEHAIEEERERTCWIRDELVGKCAENHLPFALTDRVVLCPSILQHIMMGDTQEPLAFLIRAKGCETVCGVYEFTAPEGICYIPEQVAARLDWENGDIVTIERVHLPKCVRLVLSATDRLGALGALGAVEDVRTLIEAHLSKYCVVSVGQILLIDYLDQMLYFFVESVMPDKYASLVDTDVELELNIESFPTDMSTDAPSDPAARAAQLLAISEDRPSPRHDLKQDLMGEGYKLSFSDPNPIPWYKRPQ